jgi:hypothetical protein
MLDDFTTNPVGVFAPFVCLLSCQVERMRKILIRNETARLDRIRERNWRWDDATEILKWERRCKIRPRSGGIISLRAE